MQNMIFHTFHINQISHIAFNSIESIKNQEKMMKHMPEFFGMVTVGERGQIVIPMTARKSLSIKPGDKLIALSGPPGRKGISFLPVDDFSQFINDFEKHITSMKAQFLKDKKK